MPERTTNDREHGTDLADAIDLLAVERRVQELTNAYGRARMGEVMARADASTPEVRIDGVEWGNRRVAGGTYETVFGDVAMPLLVIHLIERTSVPSRLGAPRASAVAETGNPTTGTTGPLGSRGARRSPGAVRGSLCPVRGDERPHAEASMSGGLGTRRHHAVEACQRVARRRHERAQPRDALDGVMLRHREAHRDDFFTR
jgi:hypothetical protein